MTKAIQIRVDSKLKKDADMIFDDLGLDTPTAIRLFLKKVVVSKSIPFSLKIASIEKYQLPPLPSKKSHAPSQDGKVANPEKEEQDWSQLSTQQFLEGYDEQDSIYDKL